MNLLTEATFRCKPAKKFPLFFFLIFVSFTSLSASVKSSETIIKSESIQQDSSAVQWINYLSREEKALIARDLGAVTISKNKDSLLLGGDSVNQSISFSASFRPKLGPTEEGGKNESAIPSATNYSSGGNVSCTINIQNPHAGSGPYGSRRVKAKVSGSCSYNHVIGNPPLTATWELVQTLFKIDSSLNGYPIINSYYNEEIRVGLSPAWSASSAQVYSDSCTNGLYSQTAVVYVIPPTGWIYTGQQPIRFSTPATAYVSKC